MLIEHSNGTQVFVKEGSEFVMSVISRSLMLDTKINCWKYRLLCPNINQICSKHYNNGYVYYMCIYLVNV